MNRTQRVVLVLAVLIALIGADQFTKYVATQTINPKKIATGESDWPAVIAFPASWHPNDLFRFVYATNKGAFLGLGGKLPESYRWHALTGLNAAILAALVLYLSIPARIPIPVVLALSMILSGGVGNLIDRMLRDDGRVVDFMNMGIGSLRTGVFNVADLAIVGGLVFLLAVELLRPSEKRESEKTAAPAEDA